MHKPSISNLVYKTLYPRPRAADPVSLSAHITRHIVPEVRVETQNFYGPLDCTEAQYPGLDYTWEPHRRRLSRFANHKKLFKVFDELGLTNDEILSLCVWEGTRSAKEKYERDAGRLIRDTTTDGIEAAPYHLPRPRAYFPDWHTADAITGLRRGFDMIGDDEYSEDEEIDSRTSIGELLNDRLRRRADARARGESNVLDEQFEEWMKEAQERDDMNADTMMRNIHNGQMLLGSHRTMNSQSDISVNESSSSGPVMARTSSRVPSSNPRIVDHFHSSLHNLQAMSAQLNVDHTTLAPSISRSTTEAAR